MDISDALPLVSPLIRTQVNALYSGPVTAAGTWKASGIVSYRLGSSAGATARSRPVVIEVADDGTSIQRARVSGWATCGGGRGTPTASERRNLALDGNGGFMISTPYSYRYGGIRYRGQESIDGGITGAVVRGRFSDRWTQRDAAGDTDTCATGSVRYEARTSQVAPTVTQEPAVVPEGPSGSRTRRGTPRHAHTAPRAAR